MYKLVLARRVRGKKVLARGQVPSHLEAWNIRGSSALRSPGVTTPSAWLEHEGPSGHPRLSGTIVPYLWSVGLRHRALTFLFHMGL
jgi:hypothetical protein